MRKTTKMKARTRQVLAQDLQPGDLIEFTGEWHSVHSARPYSDTDTDISISLGSSLSVSRITRGADEVIEAVDPTTVRLSKAQVACLRLAAAGRLQFIPSNRDWAPHYAAHADMFETYAGGRRSNRTLAGTALYDLGFLDFARDTRKVVRTVAADRWLAAHPE